VNKGMNEFFVGSVLFCCCACVCETPYTGEVMLGECCEEMDLDSYLFDYFLLVTY